jgi:hypothetical protein
LTKVTPKAPQKTEDPPLLNHPEYNFQSKTVKLLYFTLEKSFFFIINQFFLH